MPDRDPTVSILFDLFTSKKIAPTLIRVEKKFLINWAQREVIKRNRILRWFKKCVDLLHQEVPKDFFSLKNSFLLNFLSAWKIRFFVKKFFPFAALKTSAHFWNQRKIPLLWYPLRTTLKKIYWISKKMSIKITGPYCGAWMVLS
jgi:hypothetical protein